MVAARKGLVAMGKLLIEAGAALDERDRVRPPRVRERPWTGC